MTTIMSGIEKIDAITGGFQPGELVLICGRPGMGKSTLLERIALNVAKQTVRDKNPKYLLYFGLEKKWPFNTVPRFQDADTAVQSACVG